MENLEAIDMDDFDAIAMKESKPEPAETRLDSLERQVVELSARLAEVCAFIEQAKKAAVEQLWEQQQEAIKDAWVSQVLGGNENDQS